MRALFGGFDALVRRLQGVFEFSDDPDCLLRLRRTRLRRPLELADGQFPPGTPVLELHLWNERVPPMPPAGPDMAWATRASRRLLCSLRSVAALVEAEAPHHDGGLVCGTTILADDRTAQLLLRHLGFELHPHARPGGAVLEFWQNLYALGLMAAFNPISARRRSPSSLRRTDLWMPMDSFLRRYGPHPGPSPSVREKGLR